MTKQREVLTKKVALEKLDKVLADVAKGDIGVKAACRKHKFPIYKYSYWKKYREDVNALKSESESGVEVLADSSSATIRERLKTIDNLQRQNDLLTETVLEHEKIEVQLRNEILRLRDKIIGMVLDS